MSSELYPLEPPVSVQCWVNVIFSQSFLLKSAHDSWLLVVLDS